MRAIAEQVSAILLLVLKPIIFSSFHTGVLSWLYFFEHRDMWKTKSLAVCQVKFTFLQMPLVCTLSEDQSEKWTLKSLMVYTFTFCFCFSFLDQCQSVSIDFQMQIWESRKTWFILSCYSSFKGNPIWLKQLWVLLWDVGDSHKKSRIVQDAKSCSIWSRKGWKD